MKRPSGSLIVSIALHAVLGVLLFAVVSVPLLHDRWVMREEPRVAERIGFMRVPDLGEDTPGRSGGDGLPLTEQPPREIPLVAPSGVPDGIPQPDETAEVAPGAGTGPVIGRGGLQHGIMPSRTDPRLWSEPPREPTLPLTPAERVDSVISVTIRAYHDSIAAAPRERRAGDWTVERGGRKYGVDERYIHLGGRRLPTAVLALLPLNVQGNPIAADREKALTQMRQTIHDQAQRAAADDDFSAALKRIRERKDRERRERQETTVASP